MSYSEYCRRNKGVQKQQVLWRNTLINDHVFEQDLEAATQEIDDRLAALSRKMLPEASTVRKGTFKIPLRVLQVPRTFNFASFWEKLQSNKFFQTLAAILPLKDLLSLLSCSKQLSRTIINEELWRLLLNRDFPGMKIEEDALNYISVKQYYMFLALTKKPSLFHHTGFIVREGPPKEFGLIRTLIDFSSTKSLKRVLNMKVGVEIPKDMKLSWLKGENKLVMWIEMGNDWCKVIHVYELPEEEKIQRAFFLDEKYLVVETNKEEWEQTVRVYDIGRDLMNLITRNGDPEALRVVFNRKTLTAALNDVVVMEKEEEVSLQAIVEVDSENTVGKLALGVKILEDDLAIFYSKNSVSPLFVLVEMSSGKKIHQETLKMDSMLYEVLIPKKPQDQKVYLLDYQLNVYCKTFITTEPSQCERIFETYHQEASRLMDDNITLYYHGVISSSSSSETVEYLVILDETHHFNFINLESRKVHKYKANPHSGSYSISNWSINGDNLMWLNKSITNLAKIAWQEGDFTIRKLGFQSTDDCRDASSVAREWILINPCYTLHITTFSKKGQNSTKLRITICSTQKLILNTIYGQLTSFFDETGMAAIFDQIFYQSYDVDNMLSELEYDRKKEGKGLQGEFLFKFEGEKLMIKNSDYSVYFDLERFWRQAQFVNNKWQGGIAKLDVLTVWSFRKMQKQNNMIKNSGQQEGIRAVFGSEKKVVKKVYRENKNGVNEKPKNKSKGWKKPVPQKIKEIIKAANILRHKGYKYYKIVRRDERIEKWQKALDIEGIGGGQGCESEEEEDLPSTEDEEFEFESEYSF